MLFTLKIINLKSRFQVIVRHEGKEVFRAGWHGGQFVFRDKTYMLIGPYHEISGHEGLFWVAELVPQSIDY